MPFSSPMDTPLPEYPAPILVSEESRKQFLATVGLVCYLVKQYYALSDLESKCLVFESIMRLFHALEAVREYQSLTIPDNDDTFDRYIFLFSQQLNTKERYHILSEEIYEEYYNEFMTRLYSFIERQTEVLASEA